MKRFSVFILMLITIGLTCKKKGSTDGGGGPQPNPVPVDPPVANTIGFFLNDWTPKSFTTPAYTDTSLPTAAVGAFVTIDAANIVTKIPGPVFGQNANIWMTQMVTEPVLMNHLTNLHPNLIRFPGGSLSDLYFWNSAPGLHPSDAPDSLLDANGIKIPAGYWYGKNTASWTASLDNYYNMLQQTGNQGMITINYGYARYGMGPNP